MEKKPLPYSSKGDLTQGTVKSHLIRLTLPMIWGLFAVIFVQLIDIYFISLLGDTNILAGISFTFPITLLISHLILGFNIALSSVVSRLIGEKKDDDVRRIVLHGILIAFIVSAIISALTYIFLEPLFYMLGADQDTYPTIAEYMPFWLLASVILTFLTKSNSAMRAAGDTFIPALIMSLTAIINFVLDPLLIFGLAGFPAMGVKGAALATLIAFSTGSALALYIIIKRKKMLAIDSLHLDKIKDSMKRLLVIAVPAGIANTIVPLSTAFITAFLATYSIEAVAAFGIAGRIEALAMIFVMALSISMAPIIGQNWGAEKFDRVYDAIHLAIKANLLWSAGIAILLAALAHPIASIFSQDAEVLRITILFFWVVPFSYGAGNLVYGWASAFNAMGFPKKAFVMIAVKALILGLPAAYIAGLLYGPAGIFIALAATNLITGLLFHTKSKRFYIATINALKIEETNASQEPTETSSSNGP